MKIKTRITSWALLVAALLTVTSSLAGVYNATRSPKVSAAQPQSAAIVADDYNQTGSNQVIQHNGSYQCTANISPGAGAADSLVEPIAEANGHTSGTPQTIVQGFLADVEGKPSAATNTFNDVANGRGVLIIGFGGLNSNSDNNTACGNSMMLFRQVNSSTPTTFYGFWDTGKYTSPYIPNGRSFIFIQATVDVTNKTVSFKIPSGYSRSGSFKLNVADHNPPVIKAGNAYFPAAGGSGSGGTSPGTSANCFENANTSNKLNICVSAASDAVFTDAAQIVYAGDVYTATGWGNVKNQIVYNLTDAADPNRLAGGTPKIIMDTTQSNLDINMDNKGSLDDIKRIASSLQSAASGGKVSLTLQNVTIGGDTLKATIHANSSSLETFAAYYPKDDSVHLVFAQAGSNEQPYFGGYTRKSGTNNFTLPESNWSGKCSNFTTFAFTSDPKNPPDSNNASAKQLTVLPADWQLNANDGPCSVGHVPVKVLIEPADTDPPSGAATDTTGSSPEINCSVQFFNPLSWFLCPLATALETVVTGLDNEINNYLSIAPGKSSYPSNCNANSDKWCGYYQAWSIIRNIALGLIVVAALVAIVSQAFGLELLDAYTIRKVLPRILVASIGIALSWPLMMAFIQFTNVLGVGVRQLIYAPFSTYKVQLGGGGQFVSSFFVGGAIVALGFAGLLSFVATAALAAAVAFLVLTLRQMLIVMLVIFAPVAIVCYVLPNTQKVWKLWWDSFAKGLLMFPIIAAFIAIGRVFAAVNSTGNGSINQIISFTAYFAPYFLIPFTFRLAGGAISTIAGMANDRSRGLFDRLSKGRQARMADRFTRAQNNSLWDKNSKIGKYANKAASWATDPLSNAAYYGRGIPGLRKRGGKIASHLGEESLAQSKKLLEEINPTFNDKAYRALNGGLHGGLSAKTQAALGELNGQTPKTLADFQKMAHVLQNSDDQTERLAGNAIEGASGRLATLYQDPEMGRANIAAAGMMGLASHGFLDRRDISSATHAIKAEGGAEFAQAIGGQSQLLVARSRPDLKSGYGMDYDRASGEFVDGLETNGGLRGFEMFSTLSSGDIAGAKGGFFRTKEQGGSGDIMKEILERGKDPNANAANAAKISQALAGKTSQEQSAIRAQWKGTAEGQELLKNELAAKHYESVRKVLEQNAGPFSHGSVDVQSESARILKEANLPVPSDSRNVPPEVAAEEQARQAEAQQGGDGGMFPPGPFQG